MLGGLKRNREILVEHVADLADKKGSTENSMTPMREKVTEIFEGDADSRDCETLLFETRNSEFGVSAT